MASSGTSDETLSTRCCVVGGGPAGLMLGFLLARAGIEVVVLEKHADFLRDFRGDTIHPSTLELMHELGLLDEFLRRPHTEVKQLAVEFGDRRGFIADFSHLRTRCKFIALMPQWEFLNFLAEQAAKLPTFTLRRQAEVVDLLRDGERSAGVVAKTPTGILQVRADLVVGCDGRSSTVRSRAGLQVVDIGAPMDVLWMKLSKQPSDPPNTLGRIRSGRFLITLDRGDYWQCAYVIRKGAAEETRARGLPAFRDAIAQVAPFLADRTEELKDWDQVKLLTVKIDRLRRWHAAGLLCIGDAAHAMSPVGGVGINLAIQDAVATARILAEAFHGRGINPTVLAQVQRRREQPAQWTQAIQVVVQRKLIDRVLSNGAPERPPLAFRLLDRFPVLRRIPARLVGIGFRPEHISSLP